MAVMLRDSSKKASIEKEAHFNIDAELRKHSWMLEMSLLQAEVALRNQKPFTYLLRPGELGRKFAISFVQANGYVKHDYFTIIDPKIGMWRNGVSSHVGSLYKVIRDMMDCEMHEGQPLA